MFTRIPVNTVVAEGAAARFDCGFSASVPVAISWRRDGIVLTPSSKYTFLLNNSLVIDPTEMGDDVSYSCVIINQLTGESVQRSATLSFAGILNVYIIIISTSLLSDSHPHRVPECLCYHSCKPNRQSRRSRQFFLCKRRQLTTSHNHLAS